MPLSIIKFHDEAPQLADSQEGLFSVKLVKSRLSSEKACYLSVQYLLSFHSFSKIVNIRICKTMIFPVVFHGRETWSPTAKEERRLGGT